MDVSQDAVIAQLKAAFISLSKTYPGKLSGDLIDNFSYTFSIAILANRNAKENFVKCVRRISLRVIAMDEHILDNLLLKNLTPGLLISYLNHYFQLVLYNLFR